MSLEQTIIGTFKMCRVGRGWKHDDTGNCLSGSFITKDA